MRRTRLFGILIALLSGTALIGTGFSVFYFTGVSSSISKDGISVKLADYKSGTFKFALAKDSRLVLDSTLSKGDKFSPVYWVDNEDGIDANDGHYLRLNIAFDSQGSSLTSHSFEGTLKVEIDLEEGLSTYLRLDKGETGESDSVWSETENQQGNLVATATYSADKPLVVTTEGTWIDVPFPLTYETKDDGSTTYEPKTEAEWDELNKFNNSTIIVTVTTEEGTL